ncbi:type VII secretion protein [Lactococcus hodotermopsidis]|uniref:Type VII secretion protein n=1 Tax=Pseudolactococcus hodotermopsidis TaxID=2709157 RepID=A0A6A0B9J2_9LACT|nr:TIGR04197 family type VII secretion effector [Lactococcus hodotermopsidis]GFH41466.1 type VII secretion protein [Lactococcus hodotermopsidis]
MGNTPLKSNVGTAQAKATSLKNAVTDILEFCVVTQDSQTTVSGNMTAYEAIQKEDSLSKQVGLAVKSASENIHSVAIEFEALDKELGNIFKPNYDLLGDLK